MGDKADISGDAADLPLNSRRVELKVVTHRFWCDAVLCGRRTLCDQFGDNVLAAMVGAARDCRRLFTISAWRSAVDLPPHLPMSNGAGEQ